MFETYQLKSKVTPWLSVILTHRKMSRVPTIQLSFPRPELCFKSLNGIKKWSNSLLFPLNFSHVNAPTKLLLFHIMDGGLSVATHTNFNNKWSYFPNRWHTYLKTSSQISVLWTEIMSSKSSVIFKPLSQARMNTANCQTTNICTFIHCSGKCNKTFNIWKQLFT